MIRKNFISKLEINKFLIGSFDSCLEESKKLILENDHLKTNGSNTDNVIDEYLATLPTLFRAAITTRDMQYVGYISTIDVDYEKHSTNIVIETKGDYTEEELEYVVSKYLDYLHSSLNLSNALKVTYKIGCNSFERKLDGTKVSKYLFVRGKYLNNQDYTDYVEMLNKEHKYAYPCALIKDRKPFGIIGLNKINFANQRSEIEFVLDEAHKDFNDLGKWILAYSDFVSSIGFKYALCLVPASNTVLINSLNKAGLGYNGCIPFGHKTSDGYLESLHIYEDIIVNNNELFPEYKNLRVKDQGEILEFNDRIKLNEKYSLVRPHTLSKEELEKAVYAHAEALRNRKHFSIPLGEDKYFPQIGNYNYGISKAVKNFTYLILDNDNSYVGFINILRGNFKNAEIEIAIKPACQKQGIGTLALSAFYDELFRAGYYCVMSSVFSFNNASKNLHSKVSIESGIKFSNYYAEGTVHPTIIYSKVNPNIINANN